LSKLGQGFQGSVIKIKENNKIFVLKLVNVYKLAFENLNHKLPEHKLLYKLKLK
jgi:hypothetical protein